MKPRAVTISPGAPGSANRVEAIFGIVARIVLNFDSVGLFVMFDVSLMRSSMAARAFFSLA